MSKIKMKKIIAITGPIGSGKSTILKAMKHIVPTFSVDELQKELYKPKQLLFNLVQQKYPHFIQEGNVNKKMIKEALISDEKFKLQYQEEVIEIILSEMKTIIKDHEGVLLIEIPYINSEKIKKIFDKYIIVNAPKDIRIQRIMSRNFVSQEDALAWIDSKVENIDLGEAKQILNDGIISIDKIVEEVYTCLMF